MRVHSVSEQERIDRRRAQILEAASRVFARKGFHRTTVREVAREAGIADGTIYLYFASKQELLLALLGQLGRVGERRADFAELEGIDVRAFMDAYLRRRFAELREWRQLFAAVFPEVLADPGLLTRVAAATVVGLLVLDVLGDPVVDARWEELPAFLARLWFDGLGSEGR